MPNPSLRLDYNIYPCTDHRSVLKYYARNSVVVLRGVEKESKLVNGLVDA